MGQQAYPIFDVNITNRHLSRLTRQSALACKENFYTETWSRPILKEKS